MQQCPGATPTESRTSLHSLVLLGFPDPPGLPGPAVPGTGGRRPTYLGCGGGSPRREAEGRLMANVPPLGKTFFRKSTKKSGMSTFGSKTKVVRTEIVHILVPIPSRGDLYLTISRVSIILANLGFLVQFLVYVFF